MKLGRATVIRMLSACMTMIFLTSCATTGSSIRACNADDATVRAFQEKMSAAINVHKSYPAEAVAERVQGTVTMAFDYTHGNKAQNVKVVKSSGSIYLDASALIAVLQADLPAKPCGLEGIDHFVFDEDFRF